MRTASVLALAATAAAQAHQGFNYGSTFTTGAAKQQSDFESEFTAAKNLAGTNGAFTSARLYTTVQGGTASDPISAIPAAIKTKTGLLLGLWASAGDTAFANELQALKSAISTYGSDFTSLVQGISVGSEDLYRNSPQGIAAGSFVGANPDTVANYIKEVRSLIAGTGLSGAPIGHVDTWTAWVNGSNAAVYDACDWVGMDAYPYFEDTVPNAISEGKSLFSSALGKTSGATGKPVWITETGWPVSGKTVGSAVPSLENAKTFWDEVGCPMFGSTNVWWYTLQDASPDTPNPSFGLVGNSLTSSPVFDLSCSNVTKASSSASTSGAASSTIAASSSSTGSGSGAATTSVPAGGESNGSPGLTGLSSQLSIEASSTPTLSLSLGGSTATATGSGSAVTTYASGTGSGSGSGAGANSTIATTVKTGTTIAPTSTSTIVPANAGTVMQAGSLGAAVVAIMAAIFAL